MSYGNVAFIPLRGGSKSIPLKNIKLLNGRPLVYWVLDAAINCNHIDKVVISTDSDKIKSVVEAYDSNKIMVISRTEKTAGDNSTTESAMLEFAENYDFEKIVLIQATSPLLETKYLDEGFEKLDKYNSILSVVRQKRFIWEEIEDGYKSFNYDYFNRPMRQQFDGYLVENGAFYITDRNDLLNYRNRISGKIGIVEMCEESYFEIDEPSDWIIVENILKQRKMEENNRFRNIKMVITDVDGVLTDGGMYYSSEGDTLKKFNTKDGMGVQLLREKNIPVVIITGENSEIVKKRAEKLNIDEVYLGIKDKYSVLLNILKNYNLKLDQIAYIGDDINDLECIKSVGLGCCVSDAVEEIKRVSMYSTKCKGGEGALRELADMIIRGK